MGGSPTMCPELSKLLERRSLRAEGPASLLIFDIEHGRVRQLAVERFAVSQASAQELRPWRDRDFGCHPLGQQTPELGVMPAQIMSAAVPVFTDACPQPLHLGDQRLAGYVQILVHRHLPRSI